MKKFVFVLLAFAIGACEKSETIDNEFTGNEVIYSLQSGSDWGFFGEVSIKEKIDGSAQVAVSLENTEGDLSFPVHLHYNSFDKEAELAALLNPLSASTGVSITHLNALANEQAITYKQLVDFDGHIKIHLDESVNKDVILAYGNIGSNCDKPIDSEVAQCFDTVK